MAKTQGFEAARQLVLTDIGRAAMEDIRTELRGLIDEETAVSTSRLESSREWERRILFIAIGGANLVVITILFAAFVIFGGLRRLRQAEQSLSQQAIHLQATLDNIRGGIAMFDGRGRLTAWNALFFKLLALPTGLAKTGQPVAAFRECDPGGAQPIFDETRPDSSDGSAGGVGAGGVLRRLNVGGRDLEIQQNEMPGGGFITTLFDVTQRLRAESMLQQAQKMEAIGQLTGGVAHDFNNLLQVIMGNLNILAREMQGNEPALRRIRNALLGADRGASLTRHLLAFSRRQPLSPVPLNLGRLIREMTDMLRRSLGEHVQIETIVAGGLWNTLVDPSQVENAILNMAINARDAMPEGGKLTIEAGNAYLDGSYAAEHMEVAAGQYVMLALTDTGTGMTADIMAHAFDPFFTTKEEGRGTGLGLSMVWGFVKQSGGHVKIYSELGQGTTIKVYLPREIRPEERAPLSYDHSILGGRERVLVVEDDEQVRHAVVEMMTQLGYHAITAEDGDRALVLLHGGTVVDLLFTDVVIPGEVGSRELARRAKAILPGLKVLYTSGYTENAVIHHGRLDPRRRAAEQALSHRGTGPQDPCCPGRRQGRYRPRRRRGKARTAARAGGGRRCLGAGGGGGIPGRSRLGGGGGGDGTPGAGRSRGPWRYRPAHHRCRASRHRRPRPRRRGAQAAPVAEDHPRLGLFRAGTAPKAQRRATGGYPAPDQALRSRRSAPGDREPGGVGMAGTSPAMTSRGAASREKRRCPGHTSAAAGGWAQKRAWEIATLSVVASKGFVTTKAGSSISPVSSRSGKAVTKITGTSIDFRIS